MSSGFYINLSLLISLIQETFSTQIASEEFQNRLNDMVQGFGNFQDLVLAFLSRADSFKNCDAATKIQETNIEDCLQYLSNLLCLEIEFFLPNKLSRKVSPSTSRLDSVRLNINWSRTVDDIFAEALFLNVSFSIKKTLSETKNYSDFLCLKTLHFIF